MALEKFNYQANKSYKDGIEFNTLVTEFESGKEQRRAKGLPRRIFTLEFEKSTTTSSEAQAIWDFFVARKGKFEPFLWDYTNADGVTEELTVRFDQDTLDRDVFFNVMYSHGLKLIEVI